MRKSRNMCSRNEKKNSYFDSRYRNVTKSGMNLLKLCAIDDMMINVAKAARRVPMTGWQPPELVALACQDYIGREVRDMTAFEIISIFIGILTLLATFGSLIVAFLAFLDKRNKKK